MEHPTREELAEFVYAELSPAKHLAVTSHIESCCECQEAVAAWRDARVALQAWKLPEVRASARHQHNFVAPALRWAIAAMILVGVGYGVGRISARQTIDVAAMRTQITQQVRGDLETDLKRFTAVELEQQRQEYQRALAAATSQWENRTLADYASLRQDVETVAYRTQEKFDLLASAQPVPSSQQNANPMQQHNP